MQRQASLQLPLRPHNVTVCTHTCANTHAEPFYFFLSSYVLGAAPPEPQQEEEEEDCEVPPNTDVPDDDDHSEGTETNTLPHEESNKPANEEVKEQEGTEDNVEEQEKATEQQETEAGQEDTTGAVDSLEAVSSDEKPEPKTEESAKEEHPELPKEEEERREEEDDEEDEDEADDEEDDEDDEAEDETPELINSTESHNDTLKTNGHAAVDTNHPSTVVPVMPSLSPLLCPLVESELSATDRDASDASYELFNGETAALSNGARHRATAPRFPELPLDPDPGESEPEEGETNLNPNTERSRTVSSSSTGDTPKGDTHTPLTDFCSLLTLADQNLKLLFTFCSNAFGCATMKYNSIHAL